MITIHREAPAKPAPGDACNGCGVCCLAEPCPLGVLLTWRRKGPCAALVWSAAERQYRCGALGAPVRDGVAAWRWKLLARWIAAGSGCDCALEAEAPHTIPASTGKPMDSPHD